MAAAPVTAPTLMHLGIAADGVLGRLERNAGELGGSGGERVHRNADARRNRSTNVITVLVDDVDISRCQSQPRLPARRRKFRPQRR